MRDGLDAFTDAGGNAAIFSGNTCFWQVRFEDDDRAMRCFKYRADEDPVLGTPDERFLSGVVVGPSDRPARDVDDRADVHARRLLALRPRRARAARARYTVWRPDHWAFEGTDLHYGDELGRADAIVAYEVDGCELTTGATGSPSRPVADGAPDGLEILATAPARLWTQDEQPSRYAHEPGELENIAMAVFGGTGGTGALASRTTTPAWRVHEARAAARSSTPASPTGRARSSTPIRSWRASPRTC